MTQPGVEPGPSAHTIRGPHVWKAEAPRALLGPFHIRLCQEICRRFNAHDWGRLQLTRGPKHHQRNERQHSTRRVHTHRSSTLRRPDPLGPRLVPIALFDADGVEIGAYAAVVAEAEEARRRSVEKAESSEEVAGGEACQWASVLVRGFIEEQRVETPKRRYCVRSRGRAVETRARRQGHRRRTRQAQYRAGHGQDATRPRATEQARGMAERTRVPEGGGITHAAHNREQLTEYGGRSAHRGENMTEGGEHDSRQARTLARSESTKSTGAPPRPHTCSSRTSTERVSSLLAHLMESSRRAAEGAAPTEVGEGEQPGTGSTVGQPSISLSNRDDMAGSKRMGPFLALRGFACCQCILQGTSTDSERCISRWTRYSVSPPNGLTMHTEWSRARPANASLHYSPCSHLALPRAHPGSPLSAILSLPLASTYHLVWEPINRCTAKILAQRESNAWHSNSALMRVFFSPLATNSTSPGNEAFSPPAS
ncbi:hypothetical protein B0H17DRAFT_1147044 [Mycena rosella]|uniref:Uncharacterized protein n=1 Tax=Mycena rosella TaxID=1033263 RepID=A0AAD7CMM3_MYCRO|nr:hypothetical protein B0H17DRAFT_1147044 [Mycena rosella]